MDKNAIKKYAVWARQELISRVRQRAAKYEITEKGYGDASADSVLGRVMSAEEKSQRQALIAQIREKGYEQVMEEIAYTWFNRFIALRFMEVNGYLPSRVRVFTDENNSFKPQILAEAIDMELDGLDMKKVYALKNDNKDEELFKYLIIVQCNALSTILPGMFQKINDYTELLFPDNLLREGSVIEQMITSIPEGDWTDQVQIIGWLYQYYNTEPKDSVFADLKKNIKITKEKIPAATQLFTPDWIVRYMVENSLGRLWLEGHPNEELKSEWKYYLDEAEQEPEVQAQLAEIRKEYAAIKPEDILAIDPCQGSGHILAYMFDVLVQIYEAYGYSAREAAASIVEHNIWGLDIDERAAQLAYFSVMMKARQYDRRFFSRGIQPHVYAVLESGHTNSEGKPELILDKSTLDYFADGNADRSKAVNTIMKELCDAKEYGSILSVTPWDFSDLYDRFDEIFDDTDSIFRKPVLEQLLPIVRVAEAMSQKYHVVVTNPPYMGSGGMGGKLSEYVKKNYPDSKSDLSTVFMDCCIKMCECDGYIAMINIPVWMFITSYENLRYSIIKHNTIINMVHPGRGIFGSDFGTTTFVIAKQHLANYSGYYRRLFNKQVEVETVEDREKSFFSNKGIFFSKQENYNRIPGKPISYWASRNLIEAFNKGRLLGDCIPVKKGMDTGDNNTYLRLWYEVDIKSIDLYSASKTWIPYDKGGDYRKWYGNNEYVVYWENNGYSLKHSKANLRSQNLYFRESITWNALTAGNTCFRYSKYKGSFDSSGSSMFPLEKDIPFYLGLMNSKVSQHYLNVINPTINYGAGSVAMVPVLKNDQLTAKVNNITRECIQLSSEDWDSFEVSWDFKWHPLLLVRVNIIEETGEEFGFIESSYNFWRDYANRRFAKLKANEEELNRIFIDIYGLQDELTPEVEDKDVTVRRANLQREIRSLISYAVGCMFGRYSLDVPGLAYAGGEWDDSKYTTYLPDRDAIIPICDDEYFEDDIVNRFVEFVQTVYGKDSLEENLRFIADALGGKGSSRDVIRNYFINDFYADHLKVYQKRPIYWLFDSGKKNGFKCLIYMHRYQPDTIARIRTDYVHEQQSRYRTALADLEQRMSGASTSERVKLNKQLTKMQAQAEEIRVYEEKIHHLADQMIRIDLDDGVKHNYAIFQDVLAKIK